MANRIPLVVIVGGGFAGLSAAKARRHAAVRILLIDRTNHHLFQPLLYQVAISTLSPAQIAFPIRQILHRQQNTTIVMGEVVGVDKDRKLVSSTVWIGRACRSSTTTSSSPPARPTATSVIRSSSGTRRVSIGQ